MTIHPDPPTPTPSLRLRVTLVATGLLAVLLLVLGAVIDVTLRAQARRDLNDRLLAATSRADALVAARTPPNQIAAQLNGATVRALVVTADGAAYGDAAINPDLAGGAVVPPPGPPPPPGYPFPPPPGYPPLPPGEPPAPPDATATEVVHPLPGGARLILVADTTQTTQVTRQLRQLMIGAGVTTLLVAALLLIAVSRVALRPLDRLTALATAIATGDRGRRLHPKRADTELGRAASAFDGMLEALEASERRAQHAAAVAERAEAATRRFLVDAAHELRTPIAGMQVAAEQLATSAAQHHDDEARAQHRRATLLLSDARRAGRLVADMLDLSRIDAGLPLDLQDADLAALLDAEADRTALLAPRLTVSRTGPAELQVRADPTRVTQILSNLLDNARRYTPPGGTITIDLRAGDHTAEVTVTDTGPGVPGHEHDRIFERLVRLDAGRDRDHGGAGLGLAIARALARAHGGELACLPHDGGAQFRLSLPLTAGTRP